VKTDSPGYLDVKLTVITKEAGPWLEGLEALGEVEASEDPAGWQHRRVCTSAVLRELKIRVLGYVGPPTADMMVGLVGSDRIVSDGTTEIPDVTLAEVPRIAGPPGKETLLGALKEALREAAGK
jgi:hypothetical protein